MMTSDGMGDGSRPDRHNQKRRKEMKTKASVLMSVLAVISMLMLPAPVLATPSESLEIYVDMWMTGEDSAAGTFSTSGLFTDSGVCSEVFFIADDTTHGVKTLVGAEGTITIRYQARLTWTPTTGIAEGRWVIVSGTGPYEKLHGVGDTYAELYLTTYTLWASYTGKAHFE
jgi:hypothetical protein